MGVEPQLRGRRILVTGAGGFLGPPVVEALEVEGARVVALVGPPDAFARSPAGAARLARADICDVRAVEELVTGSEVVVHLAGPSSVAASFEQPAEYARVHVQGTATLLEACRARGVPRVVHVSSAEVYGRPRTVPVPEDHPLGARSPYGAAKIGAEKLVEAYVRAHGLTAVVLRLFSVYGPGAAPRSLIPSIVSMVRTTGEVLLRDLRPIRDYCFVSDVARAVVLACAARTSALEVLNVGTMAGTSVEEVAALVLSELGLPGRPRHSGARDRPGQSEIYELVADNRRAGEVLGWRPEVSLREGLRRFLREG